MNEKLITVFTPTFNRKNTLPKCYRSLLSQTNFNFIWLIVDDGSTDRTNELVEKWKNENDKFDIHYVYKENGGLHTAYNEGIEFAETELFLCIDSDDWLPNNAIELIETIWSDDKRKKYVGIIGLDRYQSGECVGGMFPENITEMFLYEKLTKFKIKGDKKLVHKTSELKNVAPMPTFDGEKNFNPSYMMYQLDERGKLYVTNECFCIVEYQQDGMSSNIYKQYKNSPNSFAETRMLYLSFPGISPMFKLKHSIHYVSSCILSKKFIKGIKKNPYFMYTILSIVPGILLSIVTWIRGGK